MARVTTEDCLLQIQNRFLLVQAATGQARDLRAGKSPTIDTKNKELVTALQEIAEGRVSIDGDVEELENAPIHRIGHRPATRAS